MLTFRVGAHPEVFETIRWWLPYSCKSLKERGSKDVRAAAGSGASRDPLTGAWSRRLKSVTASGAEPANSHVIAPGSLFSCNKPSTRKGLHLVQNAQSQLGLLGTVHNLVPIAKRPLEKVAFVNVVSVELVTSVPSTMR